MEDLNYNDNFNKKLFSDIDSLISFIGEYQTFIQAHLNNFIVNDLTSLVLHGQLRKEFFTKCQNLSNIGCCYGFGCDGCHLYCLNRTRDGNRSNSSSLSSRSKHQNTFLSCKKSHETSFMSASISKMCEDTGCEKIVDIGSGKGYLGQHLSDLYGYSVLGIEASLQCSISAELRKIQIEKSSSSIEPTAKKCSQCKTMNYMLDANGLANSNKFIEMINAQFLESTRKENMNGSILVGLHACGDLTSNTLKLFTKENYFKGLQIVGCCYNLLTERVNESSLPGFPLSGYLKKKQFTLGKNAFMLACQCPEKWRETKQILQKSLLYRAILEKIFADKKIPRDKLENLKFRGIGKKSKSFAEYVHRICGDMDVFEITPRDAETYYKQYEGIWEELQAFHWLRMQLAPCIEKLILLDRLCYLLESGFHNAAIIKLFSPAISPRCFALICDK